MEFVSQNRKKVIPASAAHCHRKWGKDMQSRPNGKREDCIEMETEPITQMP